MVKVFCENQNVRNNKICFNIEVMDQGDRKNHY